ncbi:MULTISPECIES: IDEAL domain-containing protein [Virgibacillus]|uniref:IDEAL domain protein n=2 Tax=Virgibacillus TaxID=84406 RepID=A0A024Q900_9BACI|nr:MULTISPECIES: IDEAL domain-containing protein [Virgibacillus]EQB37505.1 hypothetical protein M948_02870 [Virgibacillus sp. CM-4]MYL40255.1 IDEAL domain-containing protein [Virgibacillus massiliensis]GGJ60455.1 hypothetical protein GCM10007111_23180 [Virgibacillus kapii]CDQ38978.1 IDEAL domain protein [Virgibacillus massiliensis]
MRYAKSSRPNSIKFDQDYLYVNIRNIDFSFNYNGKTFTYVPSAGKEIIINQKTLALENARTLFAFGHRTETIYLNLSYLLHMPSFVKELNIILANRDYAIKTAAYASNYTNDLIIDQLEQWNVKRLIDKALDNKDEHAFNELLKLL